MNAGRRSSSTATATMSPTFTAASRTSACGRERAHPLRVPAGKSGSIRYQVFPAKVIVGGFPEALGRCVADALLVFAGFDLGQPAAPILTAANERQRGERQQRGAHNEQHERDRALQEDRPVAVR